MRRGGPLPGRWRPWSRTARPLLWRRDASRATAPRADGGPLLDLRGRLSWTESPSSALTPRWCPGRSPSPGRRPRWRAHRLAIGKCQVDAVECAEAFANGDGEVRDRNFVPSESGTKNVPSLRFNRMTPLGRTYAQAFLGSVVEVANRDARHRVQSMIARQGRGQAHLLPATPLYASSSRRACRSLAVAA